MARRIPNLSLVGPPGSGKGSYGRLIARDLGTPLITVSTVLKEAGVDVSSGGLIQDEIVADILLEKLPAPPYLLDGYPRTIEQVKIMDKSWPEKKKVGLAVSLQVARAVCRAKLLGRRLCPLCGSNWNVADVKIGKFMLPPHLPKVGDPCSCRQDESLWTRRPDDVPDIVDNRLETFYSTTKPILETFAERNALFEFTPYRGFDDIGRFKEELQKRLWPSSHL